MVTDESYRIPTRYTHEQLASMIGCKRVAVSRAFARLKKIGAVQLKERHIIVKDLGTLEGLAEAGSDAVRVGGEVSVALVLVAVIGVAFSLFGRWL